MVSKIFSILEGVKKASRITKASSTDSVDKIVNEVINGDINPVEAYIMLDYLTKITSEAMKTIKPNTLDYIKKEGENSAFGVQLQLIAVNDFKFEEDKEWSEIQGKMNHFKDAITSRGKFVKDVALEALKAGKESPINYTTSITIRPTQIND